MNEIRNLVLGAMILVLVFFCGNTWRMIEQTNTVFECIVIFTVASWALGRVITENFERRFPQANKEDGDE